MVPDESSTTWRVLASAHPLAPGASALGHLIAMARLNGFDRLEELPGICRLLPDRNGDREPLVAAVATHTGLDPDEVGRLGLRRSGKHFVEFGRSVLRLSQIRLY